MKRTFLLISLVSFAVLWSCSVGPRPIEYGSDNCALCEMTIMDQRYGSELVTGKGKVYAFDSIECLVEFLKERLPEGEQAEFILVTLFDKPGELADATQSHYIHTRQLPSPMGMYLTAFGTEEEIREAKKTYGGLIFTWQELMNEFDHLHPSLLK